MFDSEAYNKLRAEYAFRSKAIFRLYPKASIRVGKGGGAWDHGQPSVVLVIIGDDTHDVIYDHELTKLQRAMDRVFAPLVEEALASHPPDPNGLAMKMKTLVLAFATMATSERTWTDHIKGLWERFTEQGK